MEVSIVTIGYNNCNRMVEKSGKWVDLGFVFLLKGYVIEHLL